MHARTNRRNGDLSQAYSQSGYTAGKAQARSRLSNGRDVLPDVDGRSVLADGIVTLCPLSRLIRVAPNI